MDTTTKPSISASVSHLSKRVYRARARAIWRTVTRMSAALWTGNARSRLHEIPFAGCSLCSSGRSVRRMERHNTSTVHVVGNCKVELSDAESWNGFPIWGASSHTRADTRRVILSGERIRRALERQPAYEGNPFDVSTFSKIVPTVISARSSFSPLFPLENPVSSVRIYIFSLVGGPFRPCGAAWN